MQWKKERIFCHAAKMLWRNRKSYALLSVTIVISFSLLLGYLAFADSELYNGYKEVMADPSNVILIYSYDAASVEAAKNIVSLADPEARLYQYVSAYTEPNMYDDRVTYAFSFLPEGGRPVFREDTIITSVGGLKDYWNSAKEVKLVAGCESLTLSGNQAIISQSLYDIVGAGKEFPFPLEMPFRWKDGSISLMALSVVGVAENADYEGTSILDGVGEVIGVHIYTTQEVLGNHTARDMTYPKYQLCIAARNPQAVVAGLKQVDGIIIHAVCRAQGEAQEEMRDQTRTKALIAAALLLVCGINLFSSFTNALSDRKYEIGIKRALGAPARSIIAQFLIEGLLVMAVNILISVAAVSDALILYKAFQWLVGGRQWIVHITSHSIATFTVCSLGITVLFSTIFAYLATQVEIAAQLKAE